MTTMMNTSVHVRIMFILFTMKSSCLKILKDVIM